MPETDVASSRAQKRAATLRQIKDLARTQLADEGAAALSLRAIARDLGMVSSNIYRYYASRDELITALIIDAYTDLAAALDAAALDFGARARAMREWATAQPHLFALVYGSAIPGYAAPGETIEPAERVAKAFAAPLRRGEPSGDGERPAPGSPTSAGDGTLRHGRSLDEPLAGQAARMAAVTGLSPEGAVALAVALATLVGHVTLELNGHFVGTFDPADALFDVVVEQVVERLS